MNFHPAYPLQNLKPAEYNPRRITTGDFEALKASLKRFGMVKPVILNGNGVLTAGHQRTKALKDNGEDSVPAIILKEIGLHDEIKFNLFHNSIETNKTKVEISGAEVLPAGYNWVSTDRICFEKAQNSTVIKEISSLILRYGAWGSVVCDQSGRVILNSDYAVAHKIIAGEDLLIYIMPQHEVGPFVDATNHDYGTYHYEALGIKAYNQLHCQLSRLAGSKRQNKSTTYENFVFPNLTRDQRLVDFGAGKLDYVKKLQQNGFSALGYEPHFQRPGGQGIDVKAVAGQIAEITADIRDKGLFDVVVLDSVLNSVTSPAFEHAVMTTCNALLGPDGTFYCGTRNIKEAQTRANLKHARSSNKKLLEFLDENNFSATFRVGVWTMQKFHTPDSLRSLLELYFDDVDVRDEGHSNIFGIGRGPKNLSLEQYEAALNIEFNMEYPGNFRHNRHGNLVRLVLEKLVQRGAQ